VGHWPIRAYFLVLVLLFVVAAGGAAAGLAALGRIGLVAFAPEQPVWSAILVWFAGLSMAGGSLLAFSQTNMKRMLAYSSIAHAGYALLGLIPGTPAGVSATMTYASAYAFMTLGAFGVGIIESFASFQSSTLKDVIVFSLLIPVLLWRSFVSQHSEEEVEE